MTMKRTISGMIGAGSLAHNRRDFIAENVNAERTYLNVKYCDENLKAVYHELFDAAVERYNAGQKRNDRKITDYYEKIRQGKQEKLFHEMIIQIGNKDDTASDTEYGDFAANILDEYMQEFQKRNSTLRVFNCYLHMDEATPHLHIDFVPYISGWKGKGMDTKVSLKQALAALGFKGGTKHDSEWNQWMNHEKEILAAVMKKHEIEWDRKGTQEEHLSVYDYKKKVRAEEVEALEQEKILLTKQNEELTVDMTEARTELEALKQEKVISQKAIQILKLRADQAEQKADQQEKRLDNLQPVIDRIDVELADFKEKIDEQLPQTNILETASAYREKKAKPLFIRMKNKIAALAAKLEQTSQKLTDAMTEVKSLKKEKQSLTAKNDFLTKKNEEYQKENEILKSISVMFDRVVRVLGEDTVFLAIQQDETREWLERENKQQPQKKQSVLKRLDIAKEKVSAREADKTKRKSKDWNMER